MLLAKFCMEISTSDLIATKPLIINGIYNSRFLRINRLPKYLQHLKIISGENQFLPLESLTVITVITLDNMS